MPKSSPSRRASGSRPRRPAEVVLMELARYQTPPKPRYTLPTAKQARDVLIAELYRHGYGRTAEAYARGEIREKQVASRVGCAAQRAEKRGERMRAKIARGVMLLASYLHEGKHTRDASPDALRVFWNHYERVHGAGGKYPLRENPSISTAVSDSNGDPLTVYHGTRAGLFNEFRPHYRPKEQLGFGIHWSEDQSFAERYAFDDSTARKGSSPIVYEANLIVRNPLYANSMVCEGTKEYALGIALAGNNRKMLTDTWYGDAPEGGVTSNGAMVIGAGDGKKCLYMQTAIDRASGERAANLIQQFGFDGVRYTARVGKRSLYHYSTTDEAQSWVVFSPTQIVVTGTYGSPEISDESAVGEIRLAMKKKRGRGSA